MFSACKNTSSQIGMTQISTFQKRINILLLKKSQFIKNGGEMRMAQFSTTSAWQDTAGLSRLVALACCEGGEKQGKDSRSRNARSSHASQIWKTHNMTFVISITVSNKHHKRT